jgi:hypothetical protein
VRDELMPCLPGMLDKLTCLLGVDGLYPVPIMSNSAPVLFFEFHCLGHASFHRASGVDGHVCGFDPGGFGLGLERGR